MEKRCTAVVIGSGFGGISLALRLQGLGYDVTMVEKLDKPGGRAYVRAVDGFKFDMGPTVITVPHFIEELFALQRDHNHLDAVDFPSEVLDPNCRVYSGISGGPHTSKYCTIVPVLPFYRIYFDDGTYFDYDGDPENTRRQIEAIEPADLDGYERFHDAAEQIFKEGFLELGYTYFKDIMSMLKVTPALFRLDAVRNLFRFSSKYFKSDKLRQVFSFETLLVGGNPLKVPAIYAMIHFVEKTWGIHYVKGGTGALVDGLVTKFVELGGVLELNAEVETIRTEKPAGARKARATGVTLKDGRTFDADIVCSNADYAHTYRDLITKAHRRGNTDRAIERKKYSMSLFVIYFGFKAPSMPLDLKHHNIILGPRYEELLTDIFDRKLLAEDFSQYLHVPTLTDPAMAPEGHHAAYTLVPVPNLKANLDWSVEGPKLMERVLTFLEERGYIPELKANLVHASFVDPRYFRDTLNSYLGNGFGVEPTLTQTAFFRPHNRSRDVDNLYLVGANTQPGAGTPSVMMSAKMTARTIWEDNAEALKPWHDARETTSHAQQTTPTPTTAEIPEPTPRAPVQDAAVRSEQAR
ncbi:MAG: phytoene desaturase family protein [Myxococcota bacterium]|nr:phytoene desaturase family protein [Myxococcota bacterium]